MYKTYSKTSRYTTTACLAAVAFLLMLVEFPIIPVVSYLKLDFSDLPVLLGTLMYGPWTGILIAILKCFLHGLVRGFSAVELLGLFANLCTSVALILPFSWAFSRRQWSMKKQLAWGSLLATIIMTVVMTLFNYYVLTPAYMQLFHWHPTLPVKELMLVGVAPFNLIKGILISIIFSLLALHMQQWLSHHQKG